MAAGKDSWAGQSVPLTGNSEIISNDATLDILTITGASGMTGDFIVCRNSAGVEKFVVPADGAAVLGRTVTGGGDMSGDTAGTGITVSATDNFGQAVYVDDGGVEHAAGWSSAIFGSYVQYAAISPSANVSMFGVTGQFHAGADLASIGNVAGVYGVAECDSTSTLDCNFFGGCFGASVPSGTIHGAGYYTGGIIISGNFAGTTNGKCVGIFIQNPTPNTGFDAAFAFGQDSAMAGVVTVAAVGGSNTHKLKVYAGGTMFYIPMYTA